MTLFAFIITSVNFQLKLMSAKFLFPTISCNELSIWYDIVSDATSIGSIA